MFLISPKKSNGSGRQKAKSTVIELQEERSSLNNIKRKLLASFSSSDGGCKESPQKKNGDIKPSKAVT